MQEPAGRPVAGLREDGQGELLPGGGVLLQPVPPALGVEVPGQGRRQSALAQLAHRLSGGQRPQHPQRLYAGQAGLSLDEGAEYGVLQLVEARPRFLAQLGQTPGLPQGAGLVKRGDDCPGRAQPAACTDQIVQHYLVPDLFRGPGVEG